MDLKLGFLNDMSGFRGINFPDIPGILNTWRLYTWKHLVYCQVISLIPGSRGHNTRSQFLEFCCTLVMRNIENKNRSGRVLEFYLRDFANT